MHHGRDPRGGDSPATTPSDHRPSIPDADSAELGRVEPTGPNNAQRINNDPGQRPGRSTPLYCCDTMCRRLGGEAGP